jgi:hypothetical protein
MTERYGSGYGDEGQRPSGRGAVTERLARQTHGAREIDLTDEAAARDAGEDQADRESSGAFEPAPAADPPAADARPGSSNIFDLEERAKQEDLDPTGYEPPVSDANPDGPSGETVVTEPGEPRADAEDAEAEGEETAEPEDSADTAPEGAGAEPATPPERASEEPGDITPTPVPAAEPPAGATAPPGLPEPPAAADAPAAPDAPADAGTPGSLLGSLDAGELRNRFLDIQAGFVDEPRQAVEEAGRFVDDLVRQVADALRQQRGQLGGATAEGSTEDLRLALRAYRQFVDRLLGMAT